MEMNSRPILRHTKEFGCKEGSAESLGPHIAGHKLWIQWMYCRPEVVIR